MLDELRATEYGRLDRLGQVYLDYTGGGLYAESQVRQHMDLLCGNVFGNPHSHNPTSLAMTELVERARAYTLAYFQCPRVRVRGDLHTQRQRRPQTGRRILPLRARQPLRAHRRQSQLGQWHPGIRAGKGRRHHLCAGGSARPAPGRGCPDRGAGPGRSGSGQLVLFSRPIQLFRRAAFSGLDRRSPRGGGGRCCSTAAAFAPTNRLDLSRWRPDFVCLSFYKIFGYPTGVGALIARKQALARLRRPWFAGGTIAIASVKGDGFFFVEGGSAFEDGTVNYLSLPAIEIGLRHIAGIGIDAIHERVTCLTAWLLQQIAALRHSNGQPMAEILGPATTEGRGGTITLNFRDPQGRLLQAARLEELANKAGISLRTGCFCNPGAGEIAQHIPAAEMEAVFAAGVPLSFMQLEQRLRQGYGLNVGAVRISVGLATNFADVYRFMAFAAGLRDKTMADLGPLERETVIRQTLPDTA